MPLITFTPNSTIKSADVNTNFSGLADGSLDLANNSMATFRSELGLNFVASGLVWSSVSGLNITMTSGVAYLAGVRNAMSAIASHTCGASKDVYIDLNANGVIGYTEVTNNSASPALSAGALRIAIVVTGASTISSVNQGSSSATAPVISSQIITVSDSLGNLIYPLANQTIIGFTSSTGTVSNTAGADVPGATTTIQINQAGQKVKITALMPAQPLATSGAVQALIKEGATTVANPDAWWMSNSTSLAVLAITVGILTPSVGAHTYKVTSNSAASNANLNAGTILMAELE